MNQTYAAIYVTLNYEYAHCIYGVIRACTYVWSNYNKILHALTYHPSEETSDANNLYQKYSRHYEDVLKTRAKKLYSIRHRAVSFCLVRG